MTWMLSPAVMRDLVPSTLQVAQALALIPVVGGFTAIGAVLRSIGNDSRTMPEADLLVGWSVVASFLVVVGGLTGIPFTVLAIIVAVAALAAGAVLWRRKQPLLAPGAGRILILLVPLLLVTLSMQPSENDDFAQWLPNLRYLLWTDHFPGVGLPPSDSVFPAYPYVTAFVGYFVSRLAGGIADTTGNRFNMLLLASLGLALISLVRPNQRVGWRAAALGLAFATLLSPTFVPKLVLSNYADCATAVALAFTAMLAARCLEGERPVGIGLIIQLAAAATILILIKQANLVFLLLLGAGALVLAPRRIGPLLLAAAAAGLVALAWRVRVAEIGGGEQHPMAFAQWHWALMGQTLHSIGLVVVNKGGYFGLALILAGVAGRALSRGVVPAERLAVLFAVTVIGFSGFLLWVYLAVYTDYESSSAASFWRYHTELGGFELAAAAAWLSGLKMRPSARLTAAFGILAIGLVVAVPVAAVPVLRFDWHPVKNFVRSLTPDLTALLPPGSRVMMVDPEGSGFMDNFLKWNLGVRYHPAPGISAFASPASVALLLANPAVPYAFVLSSSPAVAQALGFPPKERAASLLARGPDGWTTLATWPFTGFERAAQFKY